MTPHFELIYSVFTFISSTMILSKVAVLITNALAQTVHMPEWTNYLAGPTGALFGMGVAVFWLQKRLSKVEQKYDEREKERDDDRKALIEVLVVNSETLKAVRELMENHKK